MKITQEKLPASQVGLEIEITPEMSKQAYEKTLKEFIRNVKIPGFRPGKVPRQVLIQQIGSQRIKAAVVEDLIEESLKTAVEQEKIDIIGNFQLRSSFEELVKQFEPGSALVFSAAADVPPDVSLNQYKGFSVQAEEVKYDPTRVDQVLEDYRNRSATLVPVEGRSAQEKDVAVVDFKGVIAPDADDENAEPTEIPGGSAQDFQIELVEGKFIPGFIDGIIGMQAGETKEVSATFPEDYTQTDLAGKPAVFTITLKELKEKELPELDDDFAQEVSEFETLDALRESLESRFKEEAEGKTRSNQETALLEELVKHLEVDLPETLIRRETDYMLTQTAMQLSRQGMDIKQLFTEEIVARLREQSRPEAIARIQRTLVLGKIAELESIKVEEPAVAAKVKEFQETYSDQELDLNRVHQVVEEDLLKEKIFDWLLENSSVELVPEGSLVKQEAEVPEVEDAVDASTAVVDVPAEDVTPSDSTEEVVTTVEPVAEDASEATAKPAKSKKKKTTKASDAEDDPQESVSEE